MKNILVVHQGYEMYGSDRMLLLSLEALREEFENAKIDVYLPKEGQLADAILAGGYASEVLIKKIGVFRKADFKQFNFKAIGYIFINFFSVFFKVRKYDKVYVNSIVIFDYLLASLFIKNKFIIHVHEIPDGLIGSIFRLFIKLSKAKLIVVSSEVKLFFEREDANIVLNGIAGFNCSNKVSDKVINILLIGRINHQKGQAFFLRTFAKLDTNIRDAYHVRFVGDVFGDQVHFKDEILGIINENDLGSKVELIHFTTNPTQHYEWAHIVVIPSTKPESFGLVAIEGMSAGCAILGAQLGGLKDIIVNEFTGWFFEPNNENDLKLKLEQISKNTQEIVLFGQNGKERFRLFFSKASYLERFKQILKKI